AGAAGANIKAISDLQNVNLFRQYVEHKQPLSLGDVGGADYEESAKNYKAAQANGSQPKTKAFGSLAPDTGNGDSTSSASAPAPDAPGNSGRVAAQGVDTTQPGWFLHQGATQPAAATATGVPTG